MIVRTPSGAAEWQACRMLLPSILTSASLRDVWIAVHCNQLVGDRLAGVISAIDDGTRFEFTEYAVTRGFDEVVVARELLRRVVAEAVALGRSTVSAWSAGDGAAFRESGFAIQRELTKVIGDPREGYAAVAALAERARRNFADSTVEPICAETREEVGRLYAEHISQLPQFTASRLFFQADLERFGLSCVFSSAGKVEGFILVERDGATARIHARVMRPGARGTRGSAVLLAETWKNIIEAGIERVEYQFFDDVADTVKLARRMNMKVVEVLRQFVLSLPG